MELTAMHWLQVAAQEAANVFVAGSWEGLLLAAGIGFLLKLMPGTSATSRFTIWAAAFLVLALLPFLHLGQSAQYATVTVANRSFIQVDARWSTAIAALWLMASSFRAAGLIVQGRQLRVLWKNAKPVASANSCHELLAKAGVGGAQICATTSLDRPSVIGFFSPRILVPAWLLEELTPGEMEHIVLHEAEHLRRGDDWINLLQKLSLIVFPLNPFLIWMERRLCFERELACDEGVIRATGAPRAYATCLASLAERRLGHRTASLTLAAWERRSALARRVHIILRRGDVLSPLQNRGVTVAAVFSLVLGAFGLSLCPQPVTFSAPAPAISALAQSASQSASANPYAAANSPVRSLEAARDARATLTKTSLVKSSVTPRPAAQAGRYIPIARVVQVRKPSLRRAKAVAAGTQRWVVFTSLTDSSTDSSPRQTMPTVMSIRTSLYLDPSATVRGAWIIIQL